MKKLVFIVASLLLLIFSYCGQDNKPITTKTESKELIDLDKLLPINEDFAAEPLLVYFKEKIEIENFEEFKKRNLSNQPESVQKVLKMILDEIEKLDFVRSVTGVYVEHSRNVTFSIAYLLFEDELKASKAIPLLENLYVELIGQKFKNIDDKRIVGHDQKVLYTMYQSIPVYLSFFRRANVVVLIFAPTKEVFPRIFPISAVRFPLEKDLYVYPGLPDFAKVEKPNIADLKVPTDDYYIPNTSALREMADERSKLWMDYFSKYMINAEKVTQEFFTLVDRKLFDIALSFVDFRYSENLIPQKVNDWYPKEIEKKVGNNIRVSLISKKPSQPRYNKVHLEGGVRYQYPKLGFCDLEFKISGSKQTRKLRVTFSVFDKYLKIVDMKVL